LKVIFAFRNDPEYPECTKPNCSECLARTNMLQGDSVDGVGYSFLYKLISGDEVETSEVLDDTRLMLCPSFTTAYSFKERRWSK